MAVTKPAKPLGDAAKKHRELFRRALLSPLAPTMVLNDWWSEETRYVPPAPENPLPGVHPSVARGVVAFLKSGQVLMSPAHAAAVRPYLRELEARADGA